MISQNKLGHIYEGFVLCITDSSSSSLLLTMVKSPHGHGRNTKSIISNTLLVNSYILYSELEFLNSEDLKNSIHFLLAPFYPVSCALCQWRLSLKSLNNSTYILKYFYYTLEVDNNS